MTPPRMFTEVPLFNQKLWDTNAERAKEVALDAIMTGGFSGDCGAWVSGVGWAGC